MLLFKKKSVQPCFTVSIVIVVYVRTKKRHGIILHCIYHFASVSSTSCSLFLYKSYPTLPQSKEERFDWTRERTKVVKWKSLFIFRLINELQELTINTWLIGKITKSVWRCIWFFLLFLFCVEWNHTQASGYLPKAYSCEAVAVCFLVCVWLQICNICAWLNFKFAN